MRITEDIVIPEPASGLLVRSAVDGIVSRARLALHSHDRPAHPASDAEYGTSHIRAFFERWRGNEEAQAIIDSNSPAYTVLLNRSAQDILPAEIRATLSVLDLGCGSLQFHKWLISQGTLPTYYLAIDLFQTGNESYAAQNKNLVLMVADIQRKIELPRSQFSLAIAINLLPYIRDPQSVFDLVNSAAPARLLIIDPIPSLHWEVFFSQIQVYLRGEAEIVGLAEEFGWELSTLRTLRYSSIRGLVRWPISNAYLFRRQFSKKRAD